MLNRQPLQRCVVQKKHPDKYGTQRPRNQSSLAYGKADTGCGWEPADNTTLEQIFEWRWAVALLEHVMNQLRALQTLRVVRLLGRDTLGNTP